MQQDGLQRFLIESADVRGEWIHLDKTWQELLDCADYPDLVKNVLGEALAATLLLSATLKYKGTLSLQINGSGAVNLLLIQATSDGSVRGLARWGKEPEGSCLQDIFGDGNMAITVEPTDGGERYQGIVGLQAESLGDALADYFEQSEQLKTRLWLASNDKFSAGMLLQRLPNEKVDDDEGWTRVSKLSETLTTGELLSLDANTLLYRLFHEEDVRLFSVDEICFQCSCSQDKVDAMVLSIGQKDAEEMIVKQGEISIDCEFCNRHYQLDQIDVHRLFYEGTTDSNDTIH